MPSLEGQVLVVTGGTQGVGEAIALESARLGAAGVVVCGRNAENGNRVAAEIAELGAESLFVQADLADVDATRAIISACDERFGRIDGLVNAAAITTRGTLESTTVELWDHLFAVNVRGPFLLTQGAVEIMKREKISGSIVNIISVAAYCGLPHIAAYSATKGALATFTKNCANGLLHDTIRVNGIMLGWTDTPNEDVVQKQQGSPNDWLSIGEQESPFGRLLKPYDVAHLACFLLSSDSGVMTGSLIDQAQRVVGTLSMPDGITGKDI
ncbi:MAG: SDR family oxidoreductase [Planctomycetota bacterium]|nr:SDR family oxidoreductase [Planctomycetota bacterium]MED5400528.1 SDR family oxidoreductase [Planctomycetota bacterium]MED5447704.1 SDR family oxidoreductase [Planctomycetota bacterium]